MLPSLFIMSQRACLTACLSACLSDWNRRIPARGAALAGGSVAAGSNTIGATGETPGVCADLIRPKLIHYFTSPRNTKNYKCFEPDIKRTMPVLARLILGSDRPLIEMILSNASGYRNFNLLRSEISDLLRRNIFCAAIFHPLAGGDGKQLTN
ncbi:hypothetical protein [Cupriavidus taiwanensis]|uniref:hypothetical protein n=1 Tax=Cupriavidus taiwanensis TaxID=164546 RepID=UPI0011C01914|nr:hypothetical protein [Cupriavidus taiwanensis]